MIHLDAPLGSRCPTSGVGSPASCSSRCRIGPASLWRSSVIQHRHARLVVRSDMMDGRGPVQRQVSRPRQGRVDAPPYNSNGNKRISSTDFRESMLEDYDDGNQNDSDVSSAQGMSNLTKAFISGAFILGMGAGIWFDSEVTFAPQNVASTVLVDTKTPNSEVCMANGYSSMVFDQRIFVSFNPFNVYVSQPEVKPGCVLRRANFNVLETRGLVDQQAVQACKRNMNTFAFVGDLSASPQVSCVYHSEEAENQFLRNPPKQLIPQQSSSSPSPNSEVTR